MLSNVQLVNILFEVATALMSTVMMPHTPLKKKLLSLNDFNAKVAPDCMTW